MCQFKDILLPYTVIKTSKAEFLLPAFRGLNQVHGAKCIDTWLPWGSNPQLLVYQRNDLTN